MSFYNTHYTFLVFLRCRILYNMRYIFLQPAKTKINITILLFPTIATYCLTITSFFVTFLQQLFLFII